MKNENELPLPDDMTDEERRTYEAAPNMLGNHPTHRRNIRKLMEEHDARVASGFYENRPINLEGAAKELYEAASNLIADVKRRYPGEELRCQYMRALDAALAKANGKAGEGRE